MGNSSCSSASGISDAELNKLREEDEQCLRALEQQLPTSEISQMAGLSGYRVLGCTTAPKVSAKPEGQEVGLLCLQDDLAKLADKFAETRTALQSEVRFLGAKEPSGEQRFRNSRLQALCRVYDAVLRQEERQRRNLQSAQKTEEKAEGTTKSSLPPLATATLGFGLEVLLELVETFGSEKPKVIARTMDIALTAVRQIPPISLSKVDEGLKGSVETFARFFSTTRGLPLEIQNKALPVVVGLDIAKGDYGALLRDSAQLLGAQAADELAPIVPKLSHSLVTLRDYSGEGPARVAWNFRTDKHGPDIALSNENLTVTRTDSSGWGTQQVEQVLTDGVHYIEFKIDANESGCLYIGVAPTSINLANSLYGEGAWVWQADGDTYSQCNNRGHFEGYKAGDRAGLLINMEEHTLVFYRNKVRMQLEPLKDVPNEVQVAVCFGGSNQFVSIDNDADAPEDSGVGGRCFRKGKAERAVSTTPWDIAHDKEFDALLSGDASATPQQAGLFLLAALAQQGAGAFSPFGVDTTKGKTPKKYTLEKSRDFDVAVTPANVQIQIDQLAALKSALEAKNYSQFSFKQTAWASLSYMRLLLNHLFTALKLKLPESDTGMTTERKDQVRGIMKFFSLLKLEDIGVESTPENDELRDALDLQALLFTLHTFELFFPTLSSQLEFALGTIFSAESDEAEKKVATDLLTRFSEPAKLFYTLSSGSPEDRERVKTFLGILIGIAIDDAEKILNSEAVPESPTMKTLLVAQSVLFAQVAKTNCSDDFLDMAKAYMEQVVAGVEKLAGIVKSKVSDTISDDLEALIKRTMLDKLTITLLRSLTVIKFNHDFTAHLVGLISRLSDALSTLKGGKVETITTTTVESQVFESDHPYANSLDISHSVKIPGALSYTITPDANCYTENGCDYLTLWDGPNKTTEVKKWTGPQGTFDVQPLTVKQEELFFTFHSDGSVNYWGWKLAIDATIEITIVKETWADEIKNAASALLIGLCKNLIAVDCQDEKTVHSALASPLLRGGITDTGVFLITKAKPVVEQSLAKLITSTQTEEQLSAKSAAAGLLKVGIVKSLGQKKVDTKPTLASYFAQLGDADSGSYRFSKIPILEELVAGSERTVSTFEGLKAQAKVAGPLSNLGGAELDQAERALFAVFLAFFNADSIFASLVEEPREVREIVKFIVKQVAQLRPWAQLKRQQQIEASNKDVPYSEIGREVVDKCVLLLNADFQQTLKEIGVSKVLNSLLHWAAEEKGEKKYGAMWGMVKQSVAALARVKTLQGLQALRRGDHAEVADEDKKEFLGVYKLAMDFLGAEASAVDIAQEVSSRRNVATARCVGLNLLSMTFKSQAEAQKGDVQGLVASSFSEAFSAKGVKQHYSVGTEGTDSHLQACLQRSFFQLYQLLLSRLSVSAVRDLDCTTDGVTNYMLSTFEALGFPFSERDAGALLELNMREPAQFLLSWAKGQNIFEKINMIFDRSKTIVSLSVVNESEYHEEAGTEWMSLNPKNRLAGEVAEEVEGQQKLCLKMTRGSKDNTYSNPISAIRVDDMGVSVPDWSDTYSNCNELNTPERQIHYQTSDPVDGHSFLTKVTVSGWSPIDLKGEYKPFSYFWVKDITPEEEAKRNKRKAALRRAAWLLFKQLLFAAAGRLSQGTDSQSRTRLQRVFADLLAEEVKFTGPQKAEEEALQLRKLVSGKNWRSSEIAPTSLKVSAVGEWIGKIYEDSKDYQIEREEIYRERPGYDESSLMDVINEFVGKSDPLMKGHIPATEEEVKDLPAEYRNADGEVDFFCFLKAVIAQAETWLGPFWQNYVKSSKLLQALPASFAEAEKTLGSGSIADILATFSTSIHPNETDSFLTYLQLFSAAEQPGIVPKEKAPENAPQAFFNEDGELDFFTAYKQVTANPEQFPQYFKELKMFTRAYELPASCKSFYKSSLTSAQAEYQASLLLLLYECSASTGVLSALNSSQTIINLLGHMFFGSVKTSTIAFRIMKGVVAQHSPESFADIWSGFNRSKLRVEMGSMAVHNLVHLLLAFIGVRSTVHLKSWSLLSLEKIESLGFESITLLQALLHSENWRTIIITYCCHLLTAGNADTLTVGALSFLRSLDGHRGILMREWVRVELKGAGVSQGTLIQHKAGKLKLYCEGDDSLHVENADTFVSTLATGTMALGSLPEDWVGILAKKCADLAAKYLPLAADRSLRVEDSLRLGGLYRSIGSSAVEILAILCETPYELSFSSQTPQSLAALLFAVVETKTQPCAHAAVYYQLRNILHSKLKPKPAAAPKAPTALSEEEEGKIIAGYSEDKQILVVSLKSMGLCFADIQEAIEKGHTEAEAAIKYIEERNAANPALKVEQTSPVVPILYKLKGADSAPSPLDSSGLAVFSETPKGHLVIRCEGGSSRKEYTKRFGESVFSGLDAMPREVTVLAALSSTGASFGFKLGALETLASGVFELYSLRIFVEFSGAVTVQNYETGEVISTSEGGFDFEDIANVKFGVILESTGRVELKGVAVVNGHYEGKAEFFEADVEGEPATGRFVPYQLKRRDAVTSVLQSALGLNSDKAREIAEQSKGSISASVSKALKSQGEYTGFSTGCTHFFSDLQAINIGEAVPESLYAVDILDGDMKCASDPDYKGKTLAAKDAASLDDEVVTGFEISNEEIVVKKDKDAKATAVRGVLIVKVRDLEAVDIPAGYEVVGEPGKGFNLSPESPTPYFLAFTRYSTFNGHAVADLAQMKKEQETSGLVDSFDASTGEGVDRKALNQEVAEYQSLSAVQLHNVLAGMERAYRRATCARLLSKIVALSPEVVDSTEKVVTLLEGSGAQYAHLKPVLAKSLGSAVVAEALLVDVVTQLVKPCFPNDSEGSSRKTFAFESSHPYDNGQDVVWTVSVPGAKSIKFTFDSRCKTENGCDYLLFSKDKDFTQELYRHTGTTWPDFELQGSTVYCKFHADGSVNEWGYKFKAVAEGAGDSDEFGASRALWLLENFACTEVARFQGTELLSALWLFLHSAPQGEALRALALLKKRFLLQTDGYARQLLSFLVKEVETLFQLESKNVAKSEILKEALAMVFELKETADLQLKNEEINKLYESLCLIKGIGMKDINFQFLLVQDFLPLKGRPLEVARESDHPHQLQFSTKEVVRKGASKLVVEFSKDSECDPDYTLLITKDLQGTEPVSRGQGAMEVQWAASPAGPDIAISNAGKTVTRTDSAGWGSAISNKTFESGKVTVIFRIDNDGDSSCLCLGAMGVNPPNLTSFVINGMGHPLWTLTRSGELHKQDSSVPGSNANYQTGDLVSMTLDFNEKKVTFAKNGNAVGELGDLSGPVTLVACFGGSNQFVSIASVTGGGNLGQLSERKEVVPYDKFYYHFPVNVGYVAHLQQSWQATKNPLHSFADDLHFKHSGSESSLVSTAMPLKGGVHLLHLAFNRVSPDATFAVGIKGGDDQLLACYQSDGVVKGPSGDSEAPKLEQSGDVELLFDTRSHELRLFNASKPVGAIANIPLEAEKDHYFAVTVTGEVEFEILVNKGIATEVDLMGRNAPAGTSTKFGYKFTAKPMYVGQGRLAVFEMLGSLQSEWEDYLKHQTRILSNEVCEQVVNYADEKFSASDKEMSSLIPDDITPTAEELVHYSLLEKLSIAQIRSAFRLVLELNREAGKLLPFISLNLKDSALTVLQKAFMSVRSLLFFKNKRKSFTDYLSRTNTSDMPTISISRQRAIKQKERGLTDSQGVASIFGQIYRAMNKASNRSLRNGERIYRVEFVGEGAIDAGGPYNETMTNMCEELMSKYLPLFVPCPNGVNNLGDNRDGWVPNPSANSPQQLDMFLFLGKLFGVAIRTQNNLNLSLPPVFWKRLILDTTTTADLKGFDECIFQTLEILRHLDENGITPSNFSLAFDGETFTTRDSSGRLVELCEGGKDRIVTFENATEFADLLEKQRLTEAAEAYAAIRKGISAIVPLDLLYTFSWKQVETLVCGAADVNVEILREKTSYSGYNAEHAVAQMFWSSLSDMTAKERSLFLRFAWGRTRLPSGKNFKNFSLAEKGVSGDPDKYLPVSHTCFFTLDLPPYTNKDIMKEKLVYAITHCQAIDLDRVAGAEGWEDE